jgi:hypothetical protein
MIKQSILFVLFVSAGSFSAMENNYVEKVTGFGSDAQHEIIYDPQIAGIMRSMDRSEEDCYIQEAAESGKRISRKEARSEINELKNRLNQAAQESDEAAQKAKQQEAQKAEAQQVKIRAKESKVAFAGMKKGFFK